MRKLSFLFLLSVLLLGQSCLKDSVRYTYTIATPVYKEKAEVYANIRSNAAVLPENPGKIYLYGNYIFLSEVDKGVHIIDNSNPAQPVFKAFINIPGNLDMAVKGNILYADLYTDLVVVDISDPLNARFVKHIPQVFPYRNYGGYFIADSNRIIVDWIRKDTTVDYDMYMGWYKSEVMLYSAVSNTNAQGGTAAVNPTGVGGSMARFGLVNDYLYCIDNNQLHSFDIGNSADPVRTASTSIGWDIETLYPFRNKLFIGSATGMFIYDISNPASPAREGQFVHARACDPVITDGNYAYVTLRDGTTCPGTSNQLDVVDVNNMSSPFLLKSYNMTHPHGLSKAGNLLFICDGRDGLKVYDAAQPGNLQLKKHIRGLETFDAIAWNNNLIVVAKEGLCQYDISNPENITERSRIPVRGN